MGTATECYWLYWGMYSATRRVYARYVIFITEKLQMNRTPFQTLLSQRILDDPSAASAARPCSFTFAARSRRPVGAHGSSTRVYCLRRGLAYAKLLVVSMCSVRYTTFSIIFPGTVG